MAHTIFLIIIIIFCFDFIVDKILDRLNTNNWSAELPEKGKDIYDSEKYRKSREYHVAKDKFSNLSGILSFIITLALLFGNGFAMMDNWLRTYTENPIVLSLLFFAVIGIASDIIGTPFALYDTFVIEEKFGFNKTTLKTFLVVTRVVVK